MTTTTPSIAKPGEKLVATESGADMDVDVFETYVVKRLHGRDRSEATPTLEDVEQAARAARAAKAAGVPGLLACDFDPERGALIEERAPGVALNVVVPLLSPEEIVHVYRETMRTGEALWDWGIYLDRSNPGNTYFDRETGRVTQIDLHDGREYNPELDTREALGERVAGMLGGSLSVTTALVFARCAKRRTRRAHLLRAEAQQYWPWDRSTYLTLMDGARRTIQSTRQLAEWLQDLDSARRDCAAYVRRIVEQSEAGEPLSAPDSVPPP